MLYESDHHRESAKLFLNKRDIINLQVKFLYQKPWNEENSLFCSKWEENGIIDTQMVARLCLPAALNEQMQLAFMFSS